LKDELSERLGSEVLSFRQLAGGASKEAWAVDLADGRALLVRRAGVGVIHRDTLTLEQEFHVLEAAVAAGVRKVVAASSASVYGLATEFPTTELQHPWANDTFYGAAKVFNEGMLRSFHAMSGLDYVSLRYFNVYGPRMDIHGLYTEVLIRWMERIEAGTPPLVMGDGQQTMDFVFTTDIARANLLAAESATTDAVFNIGTNTETSLLELAEALLEVMGRSDLPVEFGPARAVNGVTRRLASIEAAQEQLGWKPEVDLHAGLRGLVEWWRAERELA
jgi:UDP-glucose 4-epimerase